MGYMGHSKHFAKGTNGQALRFLELLTEPKLQPFVDFTRFGFHYIQFFNKTTFILNLRTADYVHYYISGC